jgi:hypothetical protein
MNEADKRSLESVNSREKINYPAALAQLVGALMVGAVMGLAGAWYSDRDRLDSLESSSVTHDAVHEKLHEFLEYRLSRCMDSLETGESRAQHEVNSLKMRIEQLERK